MNTCTFQVLGKNSRRQLSQTTNYQHEGTHQHSLSCSRLQYDAISVHSPRTGTTRLQLLNFIQGN